MTPSSNPSTTTRTVTAGVCGLPQVWGEPVSIVFDEMERCVKELGFVGVMIDPDPL